MLHEARMNFQRTIVNQAPRFPCRGAAQFNPGLEVLRRDSGGGMDNIWRRRAPSVNLFDYQSGMVTHTSEQSCPRDSLLATPAKSVSPSLYLTQNSEDP